MLINSMADKLIVSFEEYTQIVEKLAIQIHQNYEPTVLVGIMRGAAPIIDILSRILKLPIAYIVIQSYSGEGMEDKQGQLMFAREISSLAEDKPSCNDFPISYETSCPKGSLYSLNFSPYCLTISPLWGAGRFLQKLKAFIAEFIAFS